MIEVVREKLPYDEKSLTITLYGEIETDFGVKYKTITTQMRLSDEEGGELIGGLIDKLGETTTVGVRLMVEVPPPVRYKCRKCGLMAPIKAGAEWICKCGTRNNIRG